MCDRNMLEELDGIVTPMPRERLNRSVVEKIIGTKMSFRIGFKKLNGVAN